MDSCVCSCRIRMCPHCYPGWSPRAGSVCPPTPPTGRCSASKQTSLTCEEKSPPLVLLHGAHPRPNSMSLWHAFPLLIPQGPGLSFMCLCALRASAQSPATPSVSPWPCHTRQPQGHTGTSVPPSRLLCFMTPEASSQRQPRLHGPPNAQAELTAPTATGCHSEITGSLPCTTVTWWASEDTDLDFSSLRCHVT